MSECVIGRMSFLLTSSCRALSLRLMQKLLARIIKVVVDEVSTAHIVCYVDYALDGKARTVA